VEEAQSAMKKMNRKSLEGRQLSIDFAETREGGELTLFVNAWHVNRLVGISDAADSNQIFGMRHLELLVVIWCSGSALVSINVVIIHRAWLVLGWVTFTSSNRICSLSVFNQPPRPTQPGHPSRVGKMSTGVKKPRR